MPRTARPSADTPFVGQDRFIRDGASRYGSSLEVFLMRLEYTRDELLAEPAYDRPLVVDDTAC
ncbi:MAG: hypothetical protein ACE5I7_17945, partial [Candidatus Binatia bacterium]